MSKFVCLHCSHLFDEDDIATWQEGRGEYWGSPCSETVGGCPQCGEGYVETYKCEECDEYIVGEYIKTEGGYRICRNCYTIHELGDEL